jgi:hypothetical protein
LAGGHQTKVGERVKKNLRTRGVKPEVQKALIRIKAPLREEDERKTYSGEGTHYWHPT